MEPTGKWPVSYTPPTVRESIHLLSMGTLCTLSGCDRYDALDRIYRNWVAWLDAQPDETIWGLDWGACFRAFRAADPVASGLPAPPTP